MPDQCQGQSGGVTQPDALEYLERLDGLRRSWGRNQPELATMPPVQFSALQYLAQCNHYSDTPAAVTEFLGLTKGTVSQSLKALEKAEFICKQPDLKDKRSVHLLVTERGRVLLENNLPPQFLTDALTDMGERGTLLVELLDELLRTIQRSGSGSHFGICKQCHHHQQRDGMPFCGLTQEPLPVEKIELICREFTENT